MKGQPSASAPQQAAEVGEVKWSQKLPKKGHFFKVLKVGKQWTHNYNVKLFVWNSQKVIDHYGIALFWAKHRDLAPVQIDLAAECTDSGRLSRKCEYPH